MKHSRKSSGPSRIPAKLSKPLENGIAAYALAAGATGVAVLACSFPAEAAPVCKNLSVELSYTANFPFNPANQLIAPFNLAQSYHTFSTHTNTGVNRGFFARNLPGAEALVSSKGLVAGVATGASIGPAARFGKGASYGLIFTFTPSYGATSRHHRGNLQFGQTNYFGFKFLVAAKSHYGWVRLESTIVSGRTPSIRTKIMEYGYESNPDTAILAGSCGSAAQSTGGPADSKGKVSENEIPMTEIPTVMIGKDTDAQPASLGQLALGALAIPLWQEG